MIDVFACCRLPVPVPPPHLRPQFASRLWFYRCLALFLLPAIARNPSATFYHQPRLVIPAQRECTLLLLLSRARRHRNSLAAPRITTIHFTSIHMTTVHITRFRLTRPPRHAVRPLLSPPLPPPAIFRLPAFRSRADTHASSGVNGA